MEFAFMGIYSAVSVTHEKYLTCLKWRRCWRLTGALCLCKYSYPVLW